MTSKRVSQKLKRSTAKPRAGAKRTKRSAVNEFGREPHNTTLGVMDITAPGGFRPIESREPNRDRAHRWSITYPTRQALFDDTPSERRPPSLEEFHPAALEQFEEARQVAMKILDSGKVGAGECVTTISGQANTDHAPTNGQPNDRLSISIQQKGS